MIDLLLAAAVLAAETKDAPVSTRDPQSVARFLIDEGYQAKLDKDKTGDPMIRSSVGGTSFLIYFYGCKSNRDCEELQFAAAYDSPDNKGPSLETINKWNASYRYAQASLDVEKDPGIRTEVIFHEGTMSRAAFARHLEIWADSVGDFEKHIGW